MNEVTFKRVGNGEFESFLNGTKTAYMIHNGSIGMSGRGHNVYGITKDGGNTVRWLGPLRTCKQMVTASLLKGVAK